MPRRLGGAPLWLFFFFRIFYQPCIFISNSKFIISHSFRALGRALFFLRLTMAVLDFRSQFFSHRSSRPPWYKKKKISPRRFLDQGARSQNYYLLPYPETG